MSQMSNGASRTKRVFAAIVVPMFLLSMLVVITTGAAGGAAVAPTAPAPAAGAAPPVTAPFSLTLNPTVYTYSSGIKSTIATANGATFGSGAFVAFCVSTTKTFATSTSIGSVTLAGGVTTLSNEIVTLGGGSSIVTGAGTYYVAATDSGSLSAPCAGTGYTYTTPVPITVTTAAPSLASPGSVTVGSAASITPGTGWDGSSTVTLFLAQPGGSTVLGTYTTTSSGALPTTASFVVPTLAQGTYSIVAQETAGPSTAASVGITADSTFTVAPAITVSPVYFSGASGSALTISGTGFAAGSTIAAATSPSSTIEISAPLAAETTHAAATVGTDGTFTVTATTATSIGSAHSGPQTMSITTSVATYVFPDAAFVSSPNPGALGFAISPTTASYGTAISAYAYNFPADATITFYAGSIVLGTATASSLGFAELPAGATLPAMPAGSYNTVAADASGGLYSAPVAITVDTVYKATDPSGAALGGEYLPSGGTITVWAHGLVPGTSYSFTDGFLGSIGTSGDVVTVASGSLNAVSGKFLPAANGTIIFTYTAAYAGLGSSGTTGTSSGIAIDASAIDHYLSIGAPTILESEYASFLVGDTAQHLAVSNLIPGTATALYSGSPAISLDYNEYFGATILSGQGTTTGSCSATSPTVCTANSGGALDLSFTVPSAQGIATFAVVYNGQPTSAALGTLPVVVSSPGASAGSGAIAVATDSSGTAWAVGYGLLTTGSPTYALNISTSSGVDHETPSVSATTGAFAYDLASFTSQPAGTYSVILYVSTATASASLSTSYRVVSALSLSVLKGPTGTPVTATATGLQAQAYYDVYFGTTYLSTSESTSAGGLTAGVTVPLIAPGTYAISFDPAGTTTPALSATFTVTGSTTITLSTGSDPSGVATAFPNELVQFDWTPATEPVGPGTGSSSGSYYMPVEVTVYLNGTAFTTFAATPLTSVGAAPAPGGAVATLAGSFQMPNDPAGTFWSVTLGWTQLTHAVASLPFTDPVTTGTAGNAASTSGAALTPPNSQAYLADFYSSGTSLTGSTLVAEVNFNGNVFTMTYAPGAGITTGTHAASVALVSGAGTVTATFDVTGVVYGTMGSESSSITFTVSGDYNGLPFSSNSPLTLTDAAGTGSSPTDEHSWSASDALFGTWNVPETTSLATYGPVVTDGAYLQLVSGNGALLTGITPGQIAEITTAVNDTLTVPIADLNAAVTSIDGAVVKITTAFGNMTTTLSVINATLTSVAGTVATIDTSVGAITTSLSDIGAQIASVNGTLNVVAGDVVSVQTTVGTINGTVTSIHGGIATIQTDLGNLSLAVGKIPTTSAISGNFSTTLYLLYAAIALIVVTLALVAVLLARGGGRGGQGGRPAKAYEGPSSSNSTPPSSRSGGGSTGGA